MASRTDFVSWEVAMLGVVDAKDLLEIELEEVDDDDDEEEAEAGVKCRIEEAAPPVLL